MAETQVNINLDDKEDEMLEDVEEEDNKKGPRRQRKTDDHGRKAKGRGFKQNETDDDRYAGTAGKFDLIDSDETGPIRSIEGWIVFVGGVHEEATEDDILDKFNEFGEVKNLNLPLDRRTGFVKGYALVEYANKEEAERAIKEMDGQTLNDKVVNVDWAFWKGGKGAKKASTGGRGAKKFSRQH